jgi:hypothetical protein
VPDLILRRDAAPERHDEVLGRGDDALQEVHVLVEVAVVAGLDDGLLDDPLELPRSITYPVSGSGLPRTVTSRT